MFSLLVALVKSINGVAESNFFSVCHETFPMFSFEFLYSLFWIFSLLSTTRFRCAVFSSKFIGTLEKRQKNLFRSQECFQHCEKWFYCLFHNFSNKVFHFKAGGVSFWNYFKLWPKSNRWVRPTSFGHLSENYEQADSFLRVFIKFYFFWHTFQLSQKVKYEIKKWRSSRERGEEWWFESNQHRIQNTHNFDVVPKEYFHSMLECCLTAEKSIDEKVRRKSRSIRLQCEVNFIIQFRLSSRPFFHPSSSSRLHSPQSIIP